MQLGLTAVLRRTSLITRLLRSPPRTGTLYKRITLAAKAPSSVPVCPTEPGPEDCCQSGCDNCVWEVYRQDLKRYTDYMQAHHLSHAVPKHKAAKQQMVEASIDAFEQLERQLQQQQQQKKKKKPD